MTPRGQAAEVPAGYDVIRIGGYHYPVILRPEVGPHAFEHINRNGQPLCYSRRYSAVRYLRDRAWQETIANLEQEMSGYREDQ